MFTNPITSIIGVLIALCPFVAMIFPEAKPICDSLMGELVGLGFITSADGVKVPGVKASGLKSIFLLIGASVMLVTTLSACSTLLSGKAQIETIVSDVAAGTYSIEVKKDGKMLYTETWDCTTDGSKLTGCHKRIPVTVAPLTP